MARYSHVCAENAVKPQPTAKHRYVADRFKCWGRSGSHSGRTRISVTSLYRVPFYR